MIKTEEKIVLVSDIIAKAKIDESHPDIYANHAQVVMTNNELILDFYYIAPNPSPSKTVNMQATRTQRIVLPLYSAKGIATAIANTIAIFEEDHNITLPNQRVAPAEDKIKIW
jgi:hypothetical protein